MTKLDVRERVLIPASLADFLDEQQTFLGLRKRSDVILLLLQEARRKACDAVRSAAYRQRRKQAGSGRTKPATA